MPVRPPRCSAARRPARASGRRPAARAAAPARAAARQRARSAATTSTATSSTVTSTTSTTSTTDPGTFTLPAVASGFYDQTGLHEEGNYAVGWYVPGNDELRDYFVFDLSTASGTVVSAFLRLTTAPPTFTRYGSNDPTETYTVFDVSTALPTLTGGSGGVAAFTDLADGTAYGSLVATISIGETVDIPLNPAGITFLAGSSGQIALGGAMTTLTKGAADEFLFNSTSASLTRQLVVTTGREPPGSTASARYAGPMHPRGARARRAGRNAPERGQRSPPMRTAAIAVLLAAASLLSALSGTAGAQPTPCIGRFVLDGAPLELGNGLDPVTDRDHRPAGLRGGGESPLLVHLGDPTVFGRGSCEATLVTQVPRDDAFVVKAKFEGCGERPRFRVRLRFDEACERVTVGRLRSLGQVLASFTATRARRGGVRPADPDSRIPVTPTDPTDPTTPADPLGSGRRRRRRAADRRDAARSRPSTRSSRSRARRSRSSARTSIATRTATRGSRPGATPPYLVVFQRENPVLGRLAATPDVHLARAHRRARAVARGLRARSSSPSAASPAPASPRRATASSSWPRRRRRSTCLRPARRRRPRTRARCSIQETRPLALRRRLVPGDRAVPDRRVPRHERRQRREPLPRGPQRRALPGVPRPLERVRLLDRAAAAATSRARTRSCGSSSRAAIRRCSTRRTGSSSST